MSEDNLENFGASGDETARYDDRGGEKSVAQILECLEGRMNNLELHIKASQRSESSKDKDKDKEALFNVAYNVTDNISS